MFGGSSASTIFGSQGAGNFLTKLTTAAAVVFMITSLYLAYVALNAEGAGRFAAPPPGIETPAAQEAQDAPARRLHRSDERAARGRKRAGLPNT